MKNRKNKQNILIICAHPDDEVLGAGGTIAKYSQEGYNVYTIICSSGNITSPIEKEITEKRAKESLEAGRILGAAGTIFLGLRDMKLMKDLKNKKIRQTLKNYILNYNPVKIFTHAKDDVHIDHLAVFNAVNKICEEINFNGDLYSFEVWNLFNLRKRNVPRLYIDITDTFKFKVKALKLFKTPVQRLIMFLFVLPVLIRAIVAGISAHCRYAEVFYKVR